MHNAQAGRWQLHCIDPRVSRDEQFAAVRSLQDEGIIRHAGLSNVSVEDIDLRSRPREPHNRSKGLFIGHILDNSSNILEINGKK
jgi:hypothetical protein